MQLRSIAVFCGSKQGNNAAYATDATALGKLMAAGNVELIYGGGKNGLMGCVADAVMQGGGVVRGIIPTRLIEWEAQHDGITELTVVDDMHSRKRRIYELCDAAIILPGGFGTLDELFEILTWNVLSLHDKKVFLLNSDGFYNHLIEHLKRLAADGFLYEDLAAQLTILNQPEDLLPHLQPT